MSRSALLASAVAVAVASLSHSILAEVKLPSVFGSHMVLQQEKPIIVWGTASPGEQVTAKLDAQQQQTAANPAGQWRITFPAMKAGGAAHTLSVSGTNTVTFDDILVGEVWVCSGQSNMEMGIKGTLNGEQEVAAADYPQIRLLMVEKSIAAAPAADIKGSWQVCSPTTLGQGGWGGFSAAGYYFGKELHKNLNVPVGLIQSAWGGTRIEPWTTPDAFNTIPELKGIYEQVQLADVRSELHKQRATQFIEQVDAWSIAARKAVADQQPIPANPALPPQLVFKQDSQTPTGLYNSMISPIVPFGIRGAIWYQGESNCYEGMLYTKKMQALIEGWRKIWNEGDFPFYYVQIAPYLYGDQVPTMLPEFWEAQAAAMQIPNTGMASTMDIADLKDIHPKNKQDVGRRLALWALAKTYGQAKVVYSGPTFKSITPDGAMLRVSFDNIGSGLVSRDGKPLNCFEVIDAETGGFVPAEAKIDGPYVVLAAKDVRQPVAVRFAWNKASDPNLSNREGLPALPFRAGDVPKRDAVSFIPEARDYQLVYDLDLAKLGADIAYEADNRSKVTGTPDRIAYFLELQGGDGKQQYVYVSMDAFTTDLMKVGIPTLASGARFQQNVKNMNVYTNVSGVSQGVGIKGGNIEFWPNNYGPQNSTSVAGASGDAFDFGDGIGDPEDGYGCMQVHNHDAKQVIFAINNWKAGAGADLGIGNRQAQHTDWTFSNSAGSYTSKRLRVFVHTAR